MEDGTKGKKMTAQRQHVKKFDRLITPAATPAEMACDYACAPYDRTALDMDRKWGVNRLAGLVPHEMAAKFGLALGALNECLNNHDHAGATANAANCVKGLHAMDAAATAAGFQPANPELWQIEIDGRVMVFVRDADMWPAAQAAVPGATIYTLQEAAHALAQCSLPMVSAIKDAFPGAQISAVRKRTELEESLNDFIPF